MQTKDDKRLTRGGGLLLLGSILVGFAGLWAGENEDPSDDKYIVIRIVGSLIGCAVAGGMILYGILKEAR